MNIQSIVGDLRKTGLKDHEIADEIGCRPSTISMWGSGDRARRSGDYMLKLFKMHQRMCEKNNAAPAAKRKRSDQQATA